MMQTVGWTELHCGMSLCLCTTGNPYVSALMSVSRGFQVVRTQVCERYQDCILLGMQPGLSSAAYLTSCHCQVPEFGAGKPAGVQILETPSCICE